MEGSSSLVVGKGAWSKEEDDLLRACIHRYGEGKWHLIPQRSGLNRCRKSCRLRWLNYIKPTIKRGDFGEDEIDIMIRMHKLFGNRWSLIAGRLLLEDPGSKEEDITCCLSGLDGNFINELWDDCEFTEMTTKDNEFLMKDPIGWSDFLPLGINPPCG